MLSITLLATVAAFTGSLTAQFAAAQHQCTDRIAPLLLLLSRPAHARTHAHTYMPHSQTVPVHKRKTEPNRTTSSPLHDIEMKRADELNAVR